MSEKHLLGIGGAFDRIVFDGDDTAWVPERTCRVDSFDDGTDYDMEGNLYCYADATWTLSCGHRAYGNERPRYCPDCGAKVVDG